MSHQFWGEKNKFTSYSEYILRWAFGATDIFSAVVYVMFEVVVTLLKIKLDKCENILLVKLKGIGSAKRQQS